MRYLLVLSVLSLMLLSGCRRSVERDFRKALRGPWRTVFADDLRRLDSLRWHLDGLQGRMVHTPHGLELYAGNKLYSDSSHVVLWTRMAFRGDVKIEYDYTRLDTSRAESVNILYLHAQGCGAADSPQDIMIWNEERRVPAMRTYFNRMNLYHISYAVALGDTLVYDYVRARRYLPDAGQGLRGTALSSEYENTGLFLPGKTYHIVVVKQSERLYMEVTGDNKRRLFSFDLGTQPLLDGGYVGLRQMWARAARYAAFSVCELDNQLKIN